MSNQTNHGFQPYDQQVPPGPVIPDPEHWLQRVEVHSGLAMLRDDLRAITAAADHLDEVINRLVNLAVSRSILLGAAWYQQPVGEDLELLAIRLSTPALDNQSVRGQMLQAAHETLQQKKLQVFKSDRVRNASMICVPFSVNERIAGVVCGIVHDSQQNTVQALLVCQAVVTHFEQWRDGEELAEMAFELRSVAAVLELLGKVHQCDSVKEACFTIAHQLQDHFRCDYVAVGLKSQEQAATRLIAISSIADFDQNARISALFCAAFDEAIMHGSYTVFPPRAQDQRNATLAHRTLAKQMRCEAAITVPVRNDHEDIVGAITLLGHRQLDRNATARNLVQALEHPLGGGLEVVKYAEGGWLKQLLRRLLSSEKTSLKWSLVAVALIASIAMLVPVPYRVQCDCTAEPVTRSVSVAPFEGLLENTLVEPGDLVSKGQPLARMDGREIRFEMAGVIADRNRALKQRDSHMASHEVTRALMADLEGAQLEMKRQVLADRESNLEIVSSVTGMVLAGSIDHRENYPVSRGQVLFEIAPLEQLKIELAVPADEIMYIELGQMVHLRLDGFGTKKLTGEIHRIRPSSTIRDEKNVFIAELVLDNSEGNIRPGMKGLARIYTSPKRLGWTIFHRPWERLVSAIGL